MDMDTRRRLVNALLHEQSRLELEKKKKKKKKEEEKKYNDLPERGEGGGGGGGQPEDRGDISHLEIVFIKRNRKPRKERRLITARWPSSASGTCSSQRTPRACSCCGEEAGRSLVCPSSQATGGSTSSWEPQQHPDDHEKKRFFFKKKEYKKRRRCCFLNRVGESTDGSFEDGKDGDGA